jgi:hypothetical protein
LTPSPQDGGWQVNVTAEHEPDTQSAPVLHPSPVPQFAAQEPPQSTSVSLPFSTKSLHVAA